jgi:Zn-dependent protease
MQTVHGITFMPILRVQGTLLGLDARWLGLRGLVIVALMLVAAPAGSGGSLPAWAQALLGVAMLLALVFTTLGHELGHVLAGRLAGLRVRAVVLAPEGGVTIRATSDRPHVNFRTALAGPLASAVCAVLCAALAWGLSPDSFASGFLTQIGLLQLLTAMANLLPFGPMDGSRIVAAWRALAATS